MRTELSGSAETVADPPPCYSEKDTGLPEPVIEVEADTTRKGRDTEVRLVVLFDDDVMWSSQDGEPAPSTSKELFSGSLENLEAPPDIDIYESEQVRANILPNYLTLLFASR